MKKTMLVSAVAGLLGFYACKKEDKTITVTETVHDTINNTVWLNGQVDPEVLTAGLTVAYSTKVADSVLPAASTDAAAPILDTLYDRTYKVVEGQYLMIYPPNLSGYVAGYYVQIVGAKSYFKVAYTAANDLRKAARRAKKVASPAFARGTGEGYIDSAIVCKLPVDLAGDTFYVKYAAFDAENRVSAPVTATVIILPQGSAAFNDSLAGTWNYTSRKYYYKGYYNDEWTLDTLTTYTNTYYTCNNSGLTVSYSPTDIYLPSYIYNYRWAYTFGKYTYSETWYGAYIDLDVANSTCSNYVYRTTVNSEGTDNGSYSYDPYTHRMMFIYSDNTSNISIDYDIFYVSELTDHKLVLTYDYEDETDDQDLIMYQFVK